MPTRPDHIHVRDGKVDVRIDTTTWKPLGAQDAKLMTKSISNWVKGLSDGAKNYIKSAQSDIFNTGKVSVESNMKAITEFNYQRGLKYEEGQRKAAAEGRPSNIPKVYENAVKRGMKKAAEDDD